MPVTFNVPLVDNKPVTGIMKVVYKPVTSMKSKGGRSKRAEYETYVVRVPMPLKKEVDSLISIFHAEKPVTSLKQITVEELIELEGLSRPPVEVGEVWMMECALEHKSVWISQEDERWEKEERAYLARFLELADKVNECIWQIDNIFRLTCPSDYGSEDTVYKAIQLLIRFNLVESFEADAVSSLELLTWAEGQEILNWHSGRGLTVDMAVSAVREGRKDMLKTLGVGDRLPIDRKVYWHNYYSERIGKPNQDYWSWLGNIESRSFCPELTDLYSLKAPQDDLKKVLQVLAHKENPFRNSEQRHCGSYIAFSMGGEYGRWEAERKDETIRDFRDWHNNALELIGRRRLEAVYSICFGCDWSLVQEILDSSYVQRIYAANWAKVLQVSVGATPSQVKAAYRKLAKKYHPDVCADGTERMKDINRAYEEWQKIA